MYRNVCGFIYAAAVNAPIVRRILRVSTRIFANWGCDIYPCRVVRVTCLHESRMRAICMSGSTRGECVGSLISLTLLLYWLKFPCCLELRILLAVVDDVASKVILQAIEV